MLNPLLDELGVRLEESKLRENLRHELLMAERLGWVEATLMLS